MFLKTIGISRKPHMAFFVGISTSILVFLFTIISKLDLAVILVVFAGLGPEVSQVASRSLKHEI